MSRDDLFLDLRKELKRTERLASDLAWRGYDVTKLDAYAVWLRQRLKKTDVEPLF